MMARNKKLFAFMWFFAGFFFLGTTQIAIKSSPLFGLIFMFLIEKVIPYGLFGSFIVYGIKEHMRDKREIKRKINE
jgi:hypothetical protein